MGILALIDEESRFPKASDYTLVDKLNANFSSSPLYIRSKSSFSSSSQHSISSSLSSTLQSMPTFSIMHFAGQVQYDARGFLEKNRDYVAPEIIQVLRSSHVQLVSSLFQLPLTKTGALSDGENNRYQSSTLDSNASFDMNTASMFLSASHNRVQATVSTYFRYSLTDLFSKMIHGSPKFVRCFKPNNDRIPGCFDRETVLEQLKYSGILAGSCQSVQIRCDFRMKFSFYSIVVLAAKIRRYGFSHRIPFGNFIQRYSILAFPTTVDLPLTRETCESILHKLKMQNWTTGLLSFCCLFSIFVIVYHQ